VVVALEVTQLLELLIRCSLVDHRTGGDGDRLVFLHVERYGAMPISQGEEGNEKKQATRGEWDMI
jgi:hypothetical protein